MTAIAAMAPTLLMLVFFGLWVSSQRLLRKAWKREDEYQLIIADLLRKVQP